MACDEWKAALAARLYGDLDPASDAGLDAHLASCDACRASLEGLTRVRRVLAEASPSVPPAPPIVIVARAGRWRPALAFAAGLAAAALLGLGVVSGSLLRPAAAPDLGPDEAAELVRREIDRRIADLDRSAAPAIAPPSARRESPQRPITASDLEDALAHLERRIDGSRASDLDYVLDELRASERRTQSWIGDTRQALRYVALANDPGLGQR